MISQDSNWDPLSLLPGALSTELLWFLKIEYLNLYVWTSPFLPYFSVSAYLFLCTSLFLYAFTVLLVSFCFSVSLYLVPLYVSLLFVRPSVYLYFSLYICTSFCLSVRLCIYVRPSVYLYVTLSICTSLCISVLLSVYLYFSLFICTSLWMFARLSVYLCVC